MQKVQLKVQKVRLKRTDLLPNAANVGKIHGQIVTFRRATLASRRVTIDCGNCALGFIRSVTMAADLDQFQQLLNTLLSTDNDVRTQAEVRLNIR